MRRFRGRQKKPGRIAAAGPFRCRRKGRDLPVRNGSELDRSRGREHAAEVVGVVVDFAVVELLVLEVSTAREVAAFQLASDFLVADHEALTEIGRASWRERVGQYV